MMLRLIVIGLMLIPHLLEAQNQLKVTKHETYKSNVSNVYSLALSPNSRYLAYGGNDNLLMLWNNKTGKILSTFEKHSGKVISVAFRPNVGTIASGSIDNTIRLWDPNSGEMLHTLNDHSNDVNSVAFSDSGRYLASGSSDNTVKIWDASSGKLLRTLKGHSDWVFSVAFSGNGRYLASGSEDETIKLWDPSSGELLNTLKYHTGVISSIAFSPNGRYLASGSSDKTVKIWDPSSGELLRTLKGHTDGVNSITFGSGGRFLATGSMNGTIKLWDPKSGELLNNIKSHSQSVNSLAFSPKGRYLASGGYGEVIKVFQIQESYYYQIQTFVKKQTKQWREQGAYAKLAAYRRNPDSMGEVITQQAKNKFGEQVFKEVKTDGTFNYDTRNQTFKLDFPRFYPFYVEVPLKEAKAFNKHFQNLKFQNLEFDYDKEKGKFYLKKAEVFNPANKNRYHYNIDHEYQYKQQTIQKPSASDLSVELAEPQQKQRKQAKSSADQPSSGPDKARDLDPKVDLSKNLPEVSANHKNDFAVVIGNSQYQATKNVQFADRDAQLMKHYLVEVLGFKRGNVFYLENASKSDFQKYFGTKANHKGKLYNTIKHSESDVFIYYSGHGAPSQETKQGYFVPTDADPAYLTFQGYALSTFYENLSELPAQTKTVVLDACFSGADLLESVSSVRIEVKEKYKQKKDMAVLTSSTGTQYSTWYNAKQHGLFTWFFLKAIKDYRQVDTNDDRQVTFEEIHQYISDNNQGVPYYARRLHGKKQEPKLMGGEQDEVLLTY